MQTISHRVTLGPTAGPYFRTDGCRLAIRIQEIVSEVTIRTQVPFDTGLVHRLALGDVSL